MRQAPLPAGAVVLAYVAAQIGGAAVAATLAGLVGRGSAASATDLGVQVSYGVSSLALLAAAVAALRLARVRRASWPGTAWPGGRWVWGGVAAGILLKFAGDGLAALEQAITGPVRANNPLVLYPHLFARPLSFAALVFAVVVIAPAAEEFFFRGLVYGWLRGRLGPWPSSLIAGLLFAAAHADWTLVPPLWLLGVGLCWLYERSGSLWPSAAAHAALNGLAVVLTIVS